MTDRAADHNDSQRREVYELADALLAGTIGVEQSRRLTELLADDDQSLAHYIRFMCDAATLGQRGLETDAGAGPLPAGAAASGDQCAGVDPSSAARNPAPPPFAFRSFSSLFVANAGFAYLIAAVIMATATIGAHRWGSVVHWRQIAQTAGQLGDASSAQTPPGKAPRARSGETPSSSEGECVAQITAAGGCRWANPDKFSDELAHGRVILASGLLAITYKSGANVILEGPATFVVDRCNGGTLLSGKLTVLNRIATCSAAAKGAPVARTSRRPSGMVTKMPPFVIRTPQVALVDCAGSDFGVLIERPGVTFASVFRHRVNLQTPDVLSGTVWTLGENDSVELQATQGDQPLITVYPAQPAQFARDLPKEKPLYSIEVHRAKEKPGRSGRS